MVTFLVCLVVVGGASILILRVTLQDAFQGATDDPPSDGEAAHPPADEPSGQIGGTSGPQDVVSPAAVPQDGEAVGGTPPVGADPDDTVPAAAHRQVTGPAGADTLEADDRREPAPVRAAAGAGAGMDRTAGGDRVADHDDPRRTEVDPEAPGVAPVRARSAWSGLRSGQTVEHQGAPEEETADATVLVEDRPTEAGDPPGPDRTHLVSARRASGTFSTRPPRPTFGRRLTARALGALKLLALLALVGTLVALALGATAVLLSLAVRAAVGS